jgi:hypothetical protein
MKNLCTIKFILIIAFLSGCSSKTKINNEPESPSTTNALWNDSGKDSDIGFWIYEKNGTCPSIRKNSPIVFSPTKSMPKDSIKNVNVTDLKYCFEAMPEEPVQYGNNCEIGRVSYKHNTSDNKYYGTYSMQFTNGKFIEGDFIAEYCPLSK